MGKMHKKSGSISAFSTSERFCTVLINYECEICLNGANLDRIHKLNLNKLNCFE